MTAEVSGPEVGTAATAAIGTVGPERIGELLLALAVEAQAHGVDPESALRGALRSYEAAVRAAESAARSD